MNEEEEDVNLESAVSESQIDDVEGDEIETLTAEKEFLREHLDSLLLDIKKKIGGDRNSELLPDEKCSPSDETESKPNAEVRELQHLTAEYLLEMIKKHQPLITSGRFTHFDFFVILPPFIILGIINSI